MVNIFRKLKLNNWLIISTLLLLTLISYGQTLKMYFWIDDNSLIYKLQHINNYNGLWGPGAVGAGPYRHIIDQFVLFYPLFKVNPLPYYFVGLVLYFLTSVITYFFVLLLTKNKYIAFASGAIFAAGYIGAETMFGITNSWQSCRGLIMALGAFYLFYKYIKTKKIFFYLASLILFYFSMDTVFIRAHGLLFAMLAFDILFYPVTFTISSIKNFFLRQLPFITTYYYVFLVGSSSYVQSFRIFIQNPNSSFFERMTATFIPLILVPLQSLGNIFLPTFIVQNFDQLLLRLFRVSHLGSTISGLLLILLTCLLLLRYFKKEKYLTKVIIFSVVWVVVNIALYFTRETSLVMKSTHRYLFNSAFGLALFWPTLFYLILGGVQTQKQKIKFTLMVGIVVMVYLFLGITIQNDFNAKRSIPIKNFFARFTKSLPIIPKGSVIFINVANNNNTKIEFGNFFGGIFSEPGYLAIHSPNIQDYSKDFLYAKSFDDIRKSLSNGLDLNNLFTFYYGKEGLVDTSKLVRQILNEGKTIELTFFSSREDFATKTFNLPPQTPSYVPATFSFWMKVNFKPYYFDDKVSKKTNTNISIEEKEQIFKYLLARKEYFQESSVSAASFWKDQTPKLILDDRLDTSWRGHRGFWNSYMRGLSTDHEYLMIDMKKPLEISQIRWVSAQSPLVPTDYMILTSLDGHGWKLVKEVHNHNKLVSGITVVDNFPSQTARFIKMEVLGTFGNDGPELKEFEVVQSRFANLGRQNIEALEDKPFNYIKSEQDYNLAKEYIKDNSWMKIYWKSDDEIKQDPKNYVKVPIFLDGESHFYQIELPVDGLSWDKYMIDGFNFPAQITLSGAKLEYLSLAKIKGNK